MMSNIVSFCKLPANEKLFLLKAVLCLAHYRLRLETTPLKQLLSRTELVAECPGGQLSVKRLSRLLQVAKNITPMTTCLSSALAGKALFSAQGHHAELHVGVKDGFNEGLKAHAWLTFENRVVLGDCPELQSYTEMPPLG